MSLSDDLIKKLKIKFEPSVTTQFRYRTNDIVVQSDEDGIIKGDRYSRTLKKDREEKIIKDHWGKKRKSFLKPKAFC